MEEPSVGVLAFLAYRQMEQRTLAAVNAAGFPITLAQARLFQRVDAAGSRLTQLAESAQLTKQSAAYLVDELIAAGCLVRSPDPSDGRARLISITDQGKRIIAIAKNMEAEVEAEWRDHLGEGGMNVLRELLTRLRKVTDPYV